MAMQDDIAGLVHRRVFMLFAQMARQFPAFQIAPVRLWGDFI
jgi:hypothetical protein